MSEYDARQGRCNEYLKDLSLYIDQETSGQLCQDIQAHLAECPDCEVVVDTLRRTIALYRELPQPEMPEGLRKRLFHTFSLNEYLAEAKNTEGEHVVETSRTDLGMNVRLKMDFEAAVILVTESLKAQGFGVLTEIDVKSTLKKKLDVDFRPYKILGACNPPLAYRALSTAPDAGLLLPCNVTVAYVADGETDVSLVNPLAMLGVLDRPDLAPVAEEARQRLDRVYEALRKQA